MTTKIYGPWIKWSGGGCPEPPDTWVEIKLRNGTVLGPYRAGDFEWDHIHHHGGIVEYRTATEQPDLEAAEKLLRENGYTVTPPAKPLTLEDVEAMTEAPREGTEYWVVDLFREEGVANFSWRNDSWDEFALRRRLAYLKREHALIAARHIFGLKGGEL